jgi:hypothetical protein
MAEGPWRCSQCGTINEPVANSCRTCGKWPSLFDLEDSAVDEAELAVVGFQPRQVDPDAFEPRTVEVEAYEPPPPVTMEPDAAIPVETWEEEPRRHRWASAILPILLLLYFVITTIVER